MKLQEALLCIDCDSLYPFASHCPQCGSQVSYPLGRALDLPVEPSTRERSTPALEWVDHDLLPRDTS